MTPTETLNATSVSESPFRLARGSFPKARKSYRRTAVAWSNYWRKYSTGVHKLFQAGPFLEAIAERSWEVMPGIRTFARPAFFLHGQMDRVTSFVYTDNPKRDMNGGFEVVNPATRGFLLKDVILLDGSLYKSGKRIDLYSRARIPKIDRYIPRMRLEYDIPCAAIHNTYEGNEFFGLWLTDDCPNYLLAREAGVTVASARPVTTHMPAYEQWLDMTLLRTEGALLRSLTLFDDDWGNNASKRKRFRQVRKKLLSHVNYSEHPGVFILRRNSGKRRAMHNEVELAEYLRERRGFRIVDTSQDDAPIILKNCAGAQVVIGIEGSHLVHGLTVLKPHGSLLVLQPPDRFSGVLKRTTDMEDQNYGFVVGQADGDGFRVDPEEVERTLDLLPAQLEPPVGPRTFFLDLKKIGHAPR